MVSISDLPLKSSLGALLAAALLAAPPQALDLEGHPVDPLHRSAPVVVLLFVRSDCPISNGYAPEIRRLYERFAPRGAAFWMVYPDPQTSADDVRRHVAEYQYPGRVLRDPQQVLVRLARAEVTPEAAVFTGGRLLYHGRIDDRYLDFGRTRSAPTTHDLDAALEATLAGRPLRAASTRAVGCFLSDLRGATERRER